MRKMMTDTGLAGAAAASDIYSTSSGGSGLSNGSSMTAEVERQAALSKLDEDEARLLHNLDEERATLREACQWRNPRESPRVIRGF